MRKTEYPEFIRKLRPKGTCLKKAGDNYNVYQVTSKRRPGKKYPRPQTGPLLGYIDEQGFHEKKKQVFDVQDLTSYEYGYTAYLLLHEDDFVSHFKKSHAKLLVKEAKEIFRNMILILSPYSVLAIDTSFQKKSAEEQGADLVTFARNTTGYTKEDYIESIEPVLTALFEVDPDETIGIVESQLGEGVKVTDARPNQLVELESIYNNLVAFAQQRGIDW